MQFVRPFCNFVARFEEVIKNDTIVPISTLMKQKISFFPDQTMPRFDKKESNKKIELNGELYSHLGVSLQSDNLNVLMS